MFFTSSLELLGHKCVLNVVILLENIKFEGLRTHEKCLMRA